MERESSERDSGYDRQVVRAFFTELSRAPIIDVVHWHVHESAVVYYIINKWNRFLCWHFFSTKLFHFDSANIFKSAIHSRNIEQIWQSFQF